MNPVSVILGAHKAVLAPMAGVTEAPYRGICKRLGAGLTYTEMISAKGLHYNPDSAVSKALLTFSAEEVPCAVQLFGTEPELMARQAARIVEQHAQKVALIDINMGCPVSKVVSKGEGSALMRTPELAERIVAEVARAVAPVPVTVKFRKGWDEASVNAVEFGQRMEAAGALGMAVHGRTREQFYHGAADWDAIAAVKRAVSVPVLGSGDVFSAGDVVAMIERTGVDAVMVARGAQGNPWIFREVAALLDGRVVAPPTHQERIEMAREHGRALVDFGGERAFSRMRKHVAWYAFGMPGAAYMRAKVNEVTSHAQMDALLVEYRDYLEAKR